MLTVLSGLILVSSQNLNAASLPKPVGPLQRISPIPASNPNPILTNLQTLEEIVKTLFAVRTFEQAIISPNGKQVAWVETMTDIEGASSENTAIYVADVTLEATPRRITAGDGTGRYAESDVTWSPDSRRIAFLSDASAPGQLQQLYVTDLANGSTKKLTSVKGALAKPTWSPDEKTIAILFTENAGNKTGPLDPVEIQTGEIKEVAREQRLALVDVTTGMLRQISPPNLYVYQYDWSSDGKSFAAIAASGNGNNNWWIAELYTIDVRDEEMKSIYKPRLQIANPVWSPDGQQIAFIEGLMSDELITGGDIFMVNQTGGGLRNLTPGMKASATQIIWQPEGKKILFVENIDGDSGIATVETTNGKIETLWRSPEKITAGSKFNLTISIASDGKSSTAVRESFNNPPEVWAGDIGNWKRITKLNDHLKPAWGQVKSIHWTSDNYNVQGWLLYPKGFDPSKKYPLVVNVHGGPAGASTSHWPDTHDLFAGLSGMGFFVLYPNPRGSYGQGEEFVRANVKDWGYGDLRDILKGVDEAIHLAPIDSTRLGIGGWSYGGYMTMWAITQTNRFQAALAGAGMSNLQSYYGQNQIDQSLIPYFGASVYDDPAVYAKSSPINFIKNAKTPTLILVGDRDGESPAPQSWEFWRALRRLGVESTFVIYEQEGHKFSNPKHIRDAIERTLRWFGSHL